MVFSPLLLTFASSGLGWTAQIDGTVDSENGERMLKELNEVCDVVKVAGTFTPHIEI